MVAPGLPVFNITGPVRLNMAETEADFPHKHLNLYPRRKAVFSVMSPAGPGPVAAGVREQAEKSVSTTEYCAQLQEWMWHYYSGYVHWLHWAALSTPVNPVNPLCYSHNFTNHTSAVTPGDRAGHNGTAPGGGAQRAANGNVQAAGREYTIPSPLQRFVAEMVDFFILFFIKATIIFSIMHMSGMKDISKFAMHFIVEEIDEDTSMEDLQKMMLVALVYRVSVCFYEIVCIWGAGGATPGKFLLGLRVVTCDTSVLVRPNRVLVVPASNVKFSASTVRALNKNFSIALFFPAFITLLFFQHNRTVYDIVAGTIVVKRNGAR